MSARKFQDSAGTVWEVFEVRRASEATRGVSEGLQAGWLTFASEGAKRRLAPFPAGWEDAPPTELERLCAMARDAGPVQFRRESRPSGRSYITDELVAVGQGGSDDIVGLVANEAVGEQEVEVRETVRRFAREARMNSLSAVEAMLRLKALLGEKFDEASAPVQHAVSVDVRRVRKWFVETFYFEEKS